MDTPGNTGTPAKKQPATKPNPAAKYKAMVKPATSPGTDDPTKQPTYDRSLLTNGKFMVSKPDGSIGQWGSDVPNGASPNPKTKKAPIPLSDKALGRDNNYNAARLQNQAPAIPSQSKSNNYY